MAQSPHNCGLDASPATAEGGQEVEVRCPTCQHRFQLEKDRLGGEITYIQKDCAARSKVNPFMINRS